MTTVAHVADDGKPAGLHSVPVIDMATARLLDTFAIPLCPGQAGRRLERGCSGIIRARMETPAPTEGDQAESRVGRPLAWYAGPITLSMAREAAGADEPGALLARIVPGGETALYVLAAAARGLSFRSSFEELAAAETRDPPARAIAALTCFRFRNRSGQPVLVSAPPIARLAVDLDALSMAPPGSVEVTTPERLARLLRGLVARRTMDEAVSRLALLDPQLSAWRRPSRRQRAAIVACLGAVPMVLYLWPLLIWSLAHLASAVSFLALGYLRYVACTAALEARSAPCHIRSPPVLPSYTVLVALYREAHMVRGLVAALEQLDYPGDKLQILFLIEADDSDTIAAAVRHTAGRPTMGVVVCPPGVPRTKPRALCHGLAFAVGELVTVFDAEDRPHAGQLRAAAAAFASGTPDLACLQARLDIDRLRNRLQRQFAIEYAVLFNGLLPWLGDRRLPLPLGGTSNHFRREALEMALGWDPFNVTEDADLGLRLMRYGFSVDVLDSVTHEEAPAGISVWLAQRRRWIKGWMVTWLVHSRRPRVLVREIGVRNAAVFQAHSLANIGAPLCHPIGLLLLISHALGLLPFPFGHSFATDLLFAASVLALVFGYGATILLARRLLRRNGRTELARDVWIMPLYWLLSSWAAWRAVAELVIAPHHWAKTPHVPHDEEPGPDAQGGDLQVGAWSG